MEPNLEKQVRVVDEKEQDLFLLEKYKNGERTMEEIGRLEVRVLGSKTSFYYPDLHRFYEYILLHEGVLTKERCVRIYGIVPYENMDGFWQVFKENVEHSNISIFIASYAKSTLFLQCLYDELDAEQVPVVASQLNNLDFTYADQIAFYLEEKEEVDQKEFEIVKCLVELGGLDMAAIAEHSDELYEYLEYMKEEDV